MARWVRRGLVGTVVGLLVLGAVGFVGWKVWFPHHRPALRDGERYGIDVSNHQGAIDWDAVAADDIDFAYLKATEGGDHVDPRFASSWEDARAAGLDVGAYHFFTLCRPGAEQAANFLATMPDGSDLPPALDLELTGNCADRPPADDVRREVRAFVDAVEEETGETVLLYVLDDWEDRYPSRDLGDRDRPLWHRRIGPLRPGGDWTLWQYTGIARVDGIDGGVDLNVMRTL
ncbi:MAG TPA: GH25 family lysozyme [Iamia sp.]|jgi:lysozyme|nr:GH25 family lysozyme [Iamia sp.]